MSKASVPRFLPQVLLKAFHSSIIGEVVQGWSRSERTYLLMVCPPQIILSEKFCPQHHIGVECVAHPKADPLTSISILCAYRNEILYGDSLKD